MFYTNSIWFLSVQEILTVMVALKSFAPLKFIGLLAGIVIEVSLTNGQ